ncbi:hypothetical protein PO909_012000 [Leuciscus waleckii]
MDGTQDVSGVEQESICIRYVDHDLIPHEEFVGLYEVSSTTGNATAFVPATTEEHYRIDFFKMLDTVDMQLTKRFEQSSLQVLDELERVLLIGKVETLVRLLLVVPSSSAEAERSFNSLRRTRLNSTAICHIHQNKLDHLDRARICEQFISANDQRRHVFGTFN